MGKIKKRNTCLCCTVYIQLLSSKKYYLYSAQKYEINSSYHIKLSFIYIYINGKGYMPIIFY